MDFMKIFDQAVREIKREVNLKVLNVPEIEQKVLDATSDEPWGPHGSSLTEIAQATKKITECHMIMNVLWTRLTDTSSNWRHVYKALAVIEYLVANGSERAVDDIVERSYRISSLSGFEYVEPNGKDVGLNVRKKVETITSLLKDREKIQEIRNKAAANRDKYFGLSSTGITFKSGSASYSGSSFQHNDEYGGLSGAKGMDTFKTGYKDRDRSGDEIDRNHNRRGVHDKSQDKYPSLSEGTKPKKGATRLGSLAEQSHQQGMILSLLLKPQVFRRKSMIAILMILILEDLLHLNLMILILDNLLLLSQLDLFADQPAAPASFPNVDLLSKPDLSVSTETKSPPARKETTFDPFAAMPLNNPETSDLFGDFTTPSNSASREPSQNHGYDIFGNQNEPTSMSPKPAPPTKGTFQVKSGIWADSLSRGIIDLNLTAPTKVSLTDIGVVGGLTDGSEDKEKRPPASVYMGRAMAAAGSSPAKPAFPPSSAGRRK